MDGRQHRRLEAGAMSHAISAGGSVAAAVLIASRPDAEALRAERHELALLVGGRCRACAERLAGGQLLRGQSCPTCHEPIGLSDRDHAVIVEFLARRANVRVGLLAAAIGLSHLVIGWFPVASSLVVALSTAWVRLQIVQPVSRILSPSRARVSIWTSRMGTSALVAATLVVNELLTLVPIAGAFIKGLIAASEVIFIAWANARYMRWQVEREEDNLAVAWWEIGLLVGAGALLVAASVGLVAAAVAAVTAAQAMADHLLH
jgi:hypothetical protein